MRQIINNEDENETVITRYLSNMHSICYPRDFQVERKKVSGTPSGDGNVALYKHLKHQTAQVIHYTITTNMGVKRYISCLLCFEP